MILCRTREEREAALAVAEAPRTASLHQRLGDAYEEAQNYPAAVTQWRMVLDLEPDHPDRMKLLGSIDKYSLSVPPTATETEPAAGEP